MTRICRHDRGRPTVTSNPTLAERMAAAVESLYRCSGCKQGLPAEAFGPLARTGRRRPVRYYCRGCENQRQANPLRRAKARELKRLRRSDPAWREGENARNRRWKTVHKDKVQAHRRSYRPWQRANEDPQKLRARREVYNACRRGQLIKPGCCEDCQQQFPSREIHGHHEDYSKPLEVNWVCTRCHERRHHPQPEAR